MMSKEEESKSKAKPKRLLCNCFAPGLCGDEKREGGEGSGVAGGGRSNGFFALVVARLRTMVNTIHTTPTHTHVLTIPLPLKQTKGRGVGPLALFFPFHTHCAVGSNGAASFSLGCPSPLHL